MRRGEVGCALGEYDPRFRVTNFINRIKAGIRQNKR
ncbi:MAG: hypothetical protein JWP88_907, partial [Flaviaesturariibacter sp.]|nr:hypothetical protein [Flaviaesturariibacter sp.]